MKKKKTTEEETFLTILNALLEAKQVIELQNNGNCLASVNEALDLMMPEKRKKARK